MPAREPPRPEPRAPRRPGRWAGLTARALSLLLAVLAAATAAVWHLRPQWIDALQEYARDRHQAEPAAAVAAARRAVTADPADPAAALAALASVGARLAAVEKGEALGPLRREALRLATAAHRDLGHRRAALATAAAWVAWDPADLDAALTQNALQRDDPATAPAARADLLALSHRLPAATAVVRDVVAADGIDQAAQLEAIARALRLVSLVPTADLDARPWSWSAGADTPPQPLVATTAPDAMVFSLQLPAGMRHLRLWLPPATPMSLFRPTLLLPTENRAIDLGAQPVEVTGCRQVAADSFTVDDAQAPTLQWTLPEPPAAAGEARLVFAVAAMPPPWLLPLLRSASTELEAMLRGADDQAARRRLAYLRACYLPLLTIDADAGRTATLRLLRPPTATGADLVARLPSAPGGAPDQVRLPPLPGVRWRLLALRRVAPHGAAAAPIELDPAAATLDSATAQLGLPALAADAARPDVELELHADTGPLP